MSSIFYTNELILNARGRSKPNRRTLIRNYQRIAESSLLANKCICIEWRRLFASCACTRLCAGIASTHERCTWLKHSSCARLNTPFGLVAAMAAITYTANFAESVCVCLFVRLTVSVACGVITYVRCEILKWCERIALLRRCKTYSGEWTAFMQTHTHTHTNQRWIRMEAQKSQWHTSIQPASSSSVCISNSFASQ